MIDPDAQALGFLSQMKIINGIDFHIVEAGRGPCLLFLHGFPEYWGSWQRIMSGLHSEFRCIAPDLRGHGLTAKPGDLAAYRTPELIRDGLALLDHAGVDELTLVAHDWGATLAFYLALTAPQRIKQLIILNGAHPYILQDHIWENPDQRRASQYMRTLQSDPGTHDLNAENAQAIAANWLEAPLAAGKLSPVQYKRFVELWSDPSRWAAMINWYRASEFDIPEIEAPPPNHKWTEHCAYQIECPVTMIWGDQDPVFSDRMLEDLARHVSHFDLHRLKDAGHVPHRDEPDKCTDIIRQSMSE